MLTSPQILDRDPPLHFALLRLQLVELIRAHSQGNNKTAILTFAQQQLGPRASTNRDFLKDLEKTMALLFFELDKLPPDLKHLLDPDLRREVADKTNRAIVFLQKQQREAAIRQLVRMRAWAEKTARDSKKPGIPRGRIELGFGGDDEVMDDRMPGNGHEPMITT